MTASVSPVLPCRPLYALVAVLAAACATTEPPSPTPEAPPIAKEEAPSPRPPAVAVPAKPKPSPAPEPSAEPKEPPRSLGLDELAKGVKSYDDGDYAAAALQFQAALDLGLASGVDRAVAHKHLAFMACVAKRIAACRTEFRKAFADDPGFDLARAEAGHPTWGPVFRSVKAEVAKAKGKPKAKTKSRPPPGAG